MKVTGYTTGVFDLFHIGHLNILKNAKNECDHLIVGVTSDTLAAQKKGKSPIIPFSERIAIVESIKYVDDVVPQNSYDKFLAWKTLKFDIMFVGDDWKGTDLWQGIEKDFAQTGVIIRYLPYTRHTSSSLIKKIIDMHIASNEAGV